jgi:hypothetical protein
VRGQESRALGGRGRDEGGSNAGEEEMMFASSVHGLLNFIWMSDDLLRLIAEFSYLLLSEFYNCFAGLYHKLQTRKPLLRFDAAVVVLHAHILRIISLQVLGMDEQLNELGRVESVIDRRKKIYLALFSEEGCTDNIDGFVIYSYKLGLLTKSMH